jgi:hypothetical protein
MKVTSICSVVLSVIASSIPTTGSAADFGWVHPKVFPVEVAFLKSDVPDLVACIKAETGSCGLERSDFSEHSSHTPSEYFAFGADRIEFTEAPDTVHVKFPFVENDGVATQAVLVYARTDKGLVRTTAALAR